MGRHAWLVGWTSRVQIPCLHLLGFLDNHNGWIRRYRYYSPWRVFTSNLLDAIRRVRVYFHYRYRFEYHQLHRQLGYNAKPETPDAAVILAQDRPASGGCSSHTAFPWKWQQGSELTWRVGTLDTTAAAIVTKRSGWVCFSTNRQGVDFLQRQAYRFLAQGSPAPQSSIAIFWRYLILGRWCRWRDHICCQGYLWPLQRHQRHDYFTWEADRPEPPSI